MLHHWSNRYPAGHGQALSSRAPGEGVTPGPGWELPNAISHIAHLPPTQELSRSSAPARDSGKSHMDKAAEKLEKSVHGLRRQYDKLMQVCCRLWHGREQVGAKRLKLLHRLAMLPCQLHLGRPQQASMAGVQASADRQHPFHVPSCVLCHFWPVPTLQDKKTALSRLSNLQDSVRELSKASGATKPGGRNSSSGGPAAGAGAAGGLLSREIRQLENRLEKAMLKANEAQSIKGTYEQVFKVKASGVQGVSGQNREFTRQGSPKL